MRVAILLSSFVNSNSLQYLPFAVNPSLSCAICSSARNFSCLGFRWAHDEELRFVYLLTLLRTLWLDQSMLTTKYSTYFIYDSFVACSAPVSLSMSSYSTLSPTPTFLPMAPATCAGGAAPKVIYRDPLSFKRKPQLNLTTPCHRLTNSPMLPMQMRTGFMELATSWWLHLSGMIRTFHHMYVRGLESVAVATVLVGGLMTEWRFYGRPT